MRKIGARILVMGALSRSSGTHEFIGDTAERILERVSCDVLLIKPAGFRTTVNATLRSGLTIRDSVAVTDKSDRNS